MKYKIKFSEIEKVIKWIDNFDEKTRNKILKLPYNEERIHPLELNSAFSNRDFPTFKKYIGGRFAYRFIDPSNIFTIKLKEPRYFVFFQPINTVLDTMIIRLPEISGTTDTIKLEISNFDVFMKRLREWKEKNK